MSVDRRPYVFISYSRTNQEYVDLLLTHLQEHQVAFWTDEGIEPGTPRWTIAIRDHIDNCAAFVVVMTPEAEESVWVGREIRRAQILNKPILPLLLDGYEFFVLNEHQYDDVSDGRRPSPRFVKRLRHLTSTAEPGGPVDARPTVASWMDEGRRLAGLERWEAALAAFDTALELDPENPWANNNRGMVLNRMGRSEEALIAYDRAIRQKPNSVWIHINRGGALYELEQWEDALAAFDTAVQLDPDLSAASYNRGMALHKLGAVKVELGPIEEALAAYDRAIELDPGNAMAHNNRGNALLELDRPQEALAAYERAIELDPENPYAEEHRREALRKIGHDE